MCYLEPKGKKINPKYLQGDKAKAFYKLLHHGVDFTKLLGCYKGKEGEDEYESITFETEPELPQKPNIDIKQVERIEVRFYKTDHCYPEVYALRKDFPIAPHQNLSLYEFPRSLCLYEEPYEDIKTQWTPIRFLSLIRHWLTNTARGSLHEDDQPLEPFLPESRINLVVDLKVSEKDNNNLYIAGIMGDFKDTFWLSASKQKFEGLSLKPKNVYPLILDCKAVTHGIIRKKPTTVNQLHELLLKSGEDLISFLRTQLKTLYESGQATQRKDDLVVLLINIPIRRSDNTAAETQNKWGFFFVEKLTTLAQDIGIWDISENQIGLNILPDTSRIGLNTKIELVNVIDEISLEQAAHFNCSKAIETPIAIVGLGALGSHVTNLLIRSGYKNLSFIDEDVVLPHNLARHIATSSLIGVEKSQVMSIWANSIFMNGLNVQSICDNVINPKQFKSQINNIFHESKIIIDLSASISTSRFISNHTSGAKRICAFLNPSSSDLVILAESEDRSKPLNSIEHQYYRYIANSTEMSNHLADNPETLRYGGTCRDLSSIVSIDNISLFSSVISATIKNIIAGKYPDGLLGIWRIQKHFSIVSNVYTPASSISHQKNNWKVLFDHDLLTEMDQFRKSKLPNETGGVLLGSVDTTLKEIYIGAVIYSPDDSLEWPNSYIRGSSGILSEYERIQKVTSGRLSYLGEWHTHGDSSKVAMSQEDKIALNIISKEMCLEGIPTLMLILGNNCHHIELKENSI